MKKIFYIFTLIVLVCFNTGCYDQDILDSKESYAHLPEVTGLSFTVSGNVVTLNWGIPSGIPTNVLRPLSVVVQVYRYRDGVTSPLRTLNQTLPNEALTTTYTIPADAGEYRAIVKLMGRVEDPPYGTTPTVFSLGKTVTVFKR